MTDSIFSEFTEKDFQLAQPRLRLSSSYKFMRSESNKNIRMRLEDSPELEYVKLCTQKSMPPESFRLFSSQGNRRELNLNNFCMGDRYAEVVSKAFKRLPDLQKIKLEANHLTDRGMSKLVKRVSYDNITELDLSKNALGPDTIAKLSKELGKPGCCLMVLKLENCGLRGFLLKRFVDVVAENRTIRELSLAKNSLDRIDSKTIADLVNCSRSLQKLDLHYNALTPNGVLQAIADNDNLQELDFSWNALGKSPEFLDLIKKVFDYNISLRHLDLSFISLTRQQCEAMAQLISSNRTLYGLHVEGNPMMIDALGFLKWQGTAWMQDRGHLSDRMFQHRRLKVKKSTHCWLCEGWTETVFEYNPSLVSMSPDLRTAVFERLLNKDEPVFIHIDVDDWQPQLMVRLGSGTYQLKRVMPKRPLFFFFSYRGILQTSSQYASQAPKHPINKLFNYYPGYSKQLRVVSVNVMHVEGQPCSVQDLLTIQPRAPPFGYCPPVGDLPDDLEERKAPH